jgi:hypothetical protein
MEITQIEFPPDVERILEREARREGIDPTQYRSDLFAHFLKMVEQTPHFQVPIAKLSYDPAKFARSLLIQFAWDLDEAEARIHSTLTADAWDQAFVVWVESHNDLPALPPESFERASFYGERG